MHLCAALKRGTIRKTTQISKRRCADFVAPATGDKRTTFRQCGVVFHRRKSSILQGTRKRRELRRRNDIGDAFRPRVGRSSNAPRVDKAPFVSRAQVEQRLSFGEKRAFLRKESLDGGKVHHQVVALHLREVGIEG